MSRDNFSLPGYDRWLDGPYERQQEAVDEGDESVDEDLWEEEDEG